MHSYTQGLERPTDFVLLLLVLRITIVYNFPGGSLPSTTFPTDWKSCAAIRNVTQIVLMKISSIFIAVLQQFSIAKSLLLFSSFLAEDKNAKLILRKTTRPIWFGKPQIFHTRRQSKPKNLYLESKSAVLVGANTIQIGNYSQNLICRPFTLWWNGYRLSDKCFLWRG